MTNRYEGPRSRRRPEPSAIEYHRQNAPWPTCSCLACRRARVDPDPDPFMAAVKRWKGLADAEE